MRTVLRSKSDYKNFKVYCVCGGFGFPVGTASTKRIRLIGKGLVSRGIPFHVLHVGASPFRENTQRCGVFDGLNFEYLTPSVRWPNVYIIRLLFYLWGSFHLFFRLLKCRKQSVVYCYYQGCLMNLLTIWFCLLMKIPVVQEACEWWPGTANSNFFTRWMYSCVMFRHSSGALPISKLIEDRILSIAGSAYPLCRVPVLVDLNENNTKKNGLKNQFLPAMFLWCGMVDGYKRDVLFLIDAMSEMKSSFGKKIIFRIVGPCSEKARADLLSYAHLSGVSAEQMDIVGFVTESELWEYCSQAEALLMPLWNDDRSLTRFPTKLGQYLAAGRPIVTAHIGEVKNFLSNKTAMLYTPGDTTSLSLALDRLSSDPELGDRLAFCATKTVLPRVEYSSNSLWISQWFNRIYLGEGNA